MANSASSGPADLDIRPVKRPLWQRLSLVWLIPIAALAISLFATWQNYQDQGTLITIRFDNAAGITAGETAVKYRDVDVGRVESLEFAEDLSEVLVYARIDKNVVPYLDDDARFWVIRPDVSVRGITGLDTVLSGVYIEGNWDTTAEEAQTEFDGLETPALTRAGQRGSTVVLRAADGSALSAGAPVLHKGIEVGYLEKPELAENGRDVVVSAFIEAPYDRRITTSTRFWYTSGFSVTLGAGGVSLDVDSLASLIEGGVAYDTIVSGGDPIRDGQLFDIFDEEQAARDSLFVDPNAAVLEMAVLFEQSVSGLSEGAEVRFQGIRIGEVTDLAAIVVGDSDNADVRLQAVLSIEPSRLGMSADATPAAALALISDFVARGLRARMVTGNILSGTLVVELVQIEDALPAIVTLTSGDYPVIPTTDSEISDVAATAEGVLARINALPVEDLLDTAIDTLASFERLANDEYTRAAPAALVELLDETRDLVAQSDTQAIPGDLRAAINELNAIITSAAEAELVEDLDTVLETANRAVTNLESSTAGLPDLITEVEAFVAKANALALEELIVSATDTLDGIDTLLSSEEAAALPASLNGALAEMRGFLAEIREGGAIENVNAALAAANEAAQAIENSVSVLPTLSNQASSLVAQTSEVIESYSERSRFGTETLQALRDIQTAADAVTSLARTIQRNPNSLLTGR